MIGAKHPSHLQAAERAALRRRVNQMYAWLNDKHWQKCFALIDPKLTDQGKLQLSTYAEGLRGFKEAYGRINPWHVRISLHLEEASAKQRDRRPFAYVYTVWQDEGHGFHMFKERWVKDCGRWFTRVVGLVPNRQSAKGE